MGQVLIIKGADFSAVKVDKIPLSQLKSVITVNASPAGGGTVTGGGTYDIGDTVQIQATPAPGYVFLRWSDGNTSATRNITVPADNTVYTAIFQDTQTTDLDLLKNTLEANYQAGVAFLQTGDAHDVGIGTLTTTSYAANKRAAVCPAIVIPQISATNIIVSPKTSDYKVVVCYGTTESLNSSWAYTSYGSSQSFAIANNPKMALLIAREDNGEFTETNIWNCIDVAIE